MKKSLLSVLLILCLSLSAIALIACTPDENPETPFEAPSFDFERPEGLSEHSLTIEWFDSKGEPTTFKPNRPTAIVFTASDYDVKESINLDTDTDYTASVREKTLQTTSYLWNRQGFNIGIFHYEAFADDVEDNLIERIFLKEKMLYKDTEGAVGSDIVGFNLTEAFISQYLKEITDHTMLANSGGKYMQEVRFIGNGTGAVLALASAEYLDYLYENGAIGEGYLADRIDLIDPYFSNKGLGYTIDYYPETSIGSALMFSEKAISELASKGTVFTLTESDEKFYESYKNNGGNIYDGISEVDGTVTFSPTGNDTSLYLNIKKNVAYLNFSESFSEKLNETYRNRKRSTLDWFLYTVNGSDSSSVTTLSESDIRPMVDGLNMAQTGVSTSTKWCVSAWTPTIFLRAVRGYEYRMAKYSSSKGETAYTMDRFQAESYQISNIKRYKTDAPEMFYAICGYAYIQNDNADFINLNRGTVLKGVNVDIQCTLDGKTVHHTVQTGTDGFYFIDLGEKWAGASVTITVATPSKEYSYVETSGTSSSNYRNHSKNIISKAEGITTTLESSKDLNYNIYFASIAFTK